MGTAAEDPTTPAHTAGAPPSSHHIGVWLGATLPRPPRPGHLLAGWTRGNPLALLGLSLLVCKAGSLLPASAGGLGMKGLVWKMLGKLPARGSSGES